MRHRSPARWLAPLALITCSVAVYVVVESTTSSDGKGNGTAPASTTGAGTSTTKQSHKRHSYTVKSGDVLSAIAQRTGVSVAEIERLNPSVDAAALHPGQKLRLTP